jgi:hypothetical protein
MIFVGIMIICSRLFSFTWILFIFPDVLFPLLYMIVPLVVLEVLVGMILVVDVVFHIVNMQV